MCLSMRYSKKAEKAMIAKLPDEFVAYKVVVRDDNANPPTYIPACGGPALAIGRIKYDDKLGNAGGFQFFRKKKDAINCGFSGPRIKCTLKKKWVKQIGMFGDGKYQVLLANEWICPSPSDKTAIIN